VSYMETCFRHLHQQADLVQLQRGYSRAERVEADALTRVDHGKLAGHGEDGTLRGGVRELRGGGAELGDERGDVDD
jgi:hypothetical protein